MPVNTPTAGVRIRSNQAYFFSCKLQGDSHFFMAITVIITAENTSNTTLSAVRAGKATLRHCIDIMPQPPISIFGRRRPTNKTLRHIFPLLRPKSFVRAKKSRKRRLKSRSSGLFDRPAVDPVKTNRDLQEMSVYGYC